MSHTEAHIIPPHESAMVREAGEDRNEIKRLRAALTFCRDIASEELAYARVGTGAEVALRHIVRKTDENL
jgi:hypothetical protein